MMTDQRPHRDIRRVLLVIATVVLAVPVVNVLGSGGIVFWIAVVAVALLWPWPQTPKS